MIWKKASFVTLFFFLARQFARGISLGLLHTSTRHPSLASYPFFCLLLKEVLFSATSAWRFTSGPQLFTSLQHGDPAFPSQISILLITANITSTELKYFFFFPLFYIAVFSADVLQASLPVLSKSKSEKQWKTNGY